jgi:diketogulonate reductase-like aldo/keto reductase
MRNKIISILILGVILFWVILLRNNKGDFQKQENVLSEEEELELAYQWSYDNNITSQSTIERANLNWYVTRAELAKMMSSFVSNVLHRYPDTWMVCEFNDVGDIDPYLRLGVIQACQFWVMGKNVNDFRPLDTVTRGEFWAILSRALWGDEYLNWTPYYAKSLKVLNKLWVMDEIDSPLIDEKRWFIMLMLMRAANILQLDENTLSDKIHKDYFVNNYILDSWYSVPVLWIETEGLDNENADYIVYESISEGYRLINTSKSYDNEVSVWRWIRRAIRDWLVSRENLFISSKIIPWSYTDPDIEIEETLEHLWLDYLDLVMIDQPWTWEKKLYEAMERAVDSWMVHVLGAANYTAWDVWWIYSIARVKPSIIQSANHIFSEDRDLKDYIKKYWIHLESWYPFPSEEESQAIFENETIKGLAEKYNKISAQIILRWNIQNWNIAVVSPTNLEEIREYYDVFDFELTQKEMNLMNKIK